MAGDPISLSLAGIALGIVSVAFGIGALLGGTESDNVLTHIRLGPAGGSFHVVFEAEGCTDKGRIGETFMNACIEPYEAVTDDEDISCDKFLHRITYTPYVHKDNDRIDILDMEIKFGKTLSGARKPLRFWPSRMCNYCGYCRGIGEGYMEAPMYFDGHPIMTTREFRTGLSNTGDTVFSLYRDRKLTFHSGTWSNAAALDWEAQEKECNIRDLNLVELKFNDVHKNCRRRMSRRRALLSTSEVGVGEEMGEKEESKNEHIILASKTVFSKKKLVPLTFHEKDVFHVELNKTVDLHVTVDVPPEEHRRFLWATNQHNHHKGMEDRQILQRACPSCVLHLRNTFQNIKGNLGAQIN